MHTLTHSLGLATIAATVLTANMFANDYADDVKTWRNERETRLTADDGWLTVSALFFLREGVNRFGSSQRNDLVLPDHVPAEAGLFTLQGQTVTVHATAGHTLAVDGREVASARLHPSKERVTVTMDSVALWVHLSGERLAIRVRDTDAEIRKNFTGLDWYPVDARYRVRGRFTPHDVPKNIKTMNILGDIESYTSTGFVHLTLHGQALRLLPVNSDGQLWFIIRDQTGGNETYSAARFLYAEQPDADGWTTVDFNKAYNPPCAFNPHTTCPLPPPDNRLDVRIEAGEKSYAGPSAH